MVSTLFPFRVHPFREGSNSILTVFSLSESVSSYIVILYCLCRRATKEIGDLPLTNPEEIISHIVILYCLCLRATKEIGDLPFTNPEEIICHIIILYCLCLRATKEIGDLPFTSPEKIICHTVSLLYFIACACGLQRRSDLFH